MKDNIRNQNLILVEFFHLKFSNFHQKDKENPFCIDNLLVTALSLYLADENCWTETEWKSKFDF